MKSLLQKGVRQLKYRFARGALILVYHRICEAALDPWSLSVTPEHFAEHLEVLRRSFHPISLQTLAQSLRDGKTPKPTSIVITFDDGYADNLYQAQPILERFDCPATVFIVTGALGSSHEFWWDELASLILHPHSLPEQLNLTIGGEMHSWEFGKALAYGQNEFSRDIRWRAGQPAPSLRHERYLQIWKLIQPLSNDEQREVMNTLRAWVGDAPPSVTHRLLTPDECVQLSKSEQIEIGAHTIHHPSLAALSCDAQKHEISQSKQELETLLDQPIRAFSYPFGKRNDYSPETIALVRGAGFSLACSNEYGVISSATDPFQLPRIHIPDCTGAEFENRLLSKLYA
jgi:peptidoglycan/xylan/chitin deacetylase (PgdA/CDA1 family)